MTGELVPADADGAARVTRLVRDVSEALTKLATHGTPSQVALYLQAAGITGVRGSSFRCPVHRYLTAAVPELARNPQTLGVSGVWVLYSRTGSYGVGDVPEAVGAFVRRFDSGVYPDLEET